MEGPDETSKARYLERLKNLDIEELDIEDKDCGAQ